MCIKKESLLASAFRLIDGYPGILYLMYLLELFGLYHS